MRQTAVFSEHRIPLPSRVQVQTERERLGRRERRASLMLRRLAAVLAVWILLGTAYMVFGK